MDAWLLIMDTCNFSTCLHQVTKYIRAYRNHPALVRYLMTMIVSGRLLTGFLMHRLFPRSIFHLLYGNTRFDLPHVFAERAGGIPHRPDGDVWSHGS